MATEVERPRAPLSVNDLTSALLARIFTFTDPRRDGLALLLTCRRWLAVAEAECPQHMWGSVVVHSDNQGLLEQGEQVALLAGLARRAGCLSELCIQHSGYPDDYVPAYVPELAPFWPALLGAAAGSPRLRALRFDAKMQAPESFPESFPSICKALARLTSLRHLSLHPRVDEEDDTLPAGAVAPLSALTRLEGLEMWLDSLTGELPPGLLPALGRLTRLLLECSNLAQHSVAWQRPDGSGPMLRQLELRFCDVGLPPGRLLPALRQLERLSLCRAGMVEEQFDVLPHLPHLTSLSLYHCERAAWPAVLRCAALRELVTYSPRSPPPEQLPPGSLPQLTHLWLNHVRTPPAWLALPQLRTLSLDCDPPGGGDPLPGLAQCQQLEHLLVWGSSLFEVTQAASGLTRLTRLVVGTPLTLTAPQGLHEGPYLAGLRQLRHSTHGAPQQGTPTWRLPAFLAAATSLELLDLGGDRSLRLRGAEDAALLRTLPALRRVLLPARLSRAVGRIREGLRKGAGPGAGPSHAVGVEGIGYYFDAADYSSDSGDESSSDADVHSSDADVHSTDADDYSSDADASCDREE